MPRPSAKLSVGDGVSKKPVIEHPQHPLTLGSAFQVCLLRALMGLLY